MPDENAAELRPRPATMIQYDPHNLYANLGVSPLASLQEIKSAVNLKRRELSENAQKHKQGSGAAGLNEYEHKVIELDSLLQQIDTPKKRAEYDLANPQNRLLTVQIDAEDVWLDSDSVSGLISCWLLEELGADNFLPTPLAPALWTPKGVDPEAGEFLARFATGSENDAASSRENAHRILAGDLESLIDKDRAPPSGQNHETQED